MAERLGPSPEDIAKAEASKQAVSASDVGTASEPKDIARVDIWKQVLPEPLKSSLVTTDSEQFHKDKENLVERPIQVAFAEGQKSPGLASVPAMPTGSVGSPSTTPASDQAADQAQGQTPASSMTDTPEPGKTVGEETGSSSSRQPTEGAQEAVSEAPATAAQEQGEDQDHGYGYGY